MPTDTKAEKAAKHAKRAVELARQAREEDRPDTPADELVSDLRDVLASLPAEADLRLYRKSTTTGKLEFCESFAEPTAFSEEYVAQKWGAGSYRVMAKVPDPKTGKMQFVEGGTKTFTVAQRPNAPAVAAPSETMKGTLDTVTLMHQMMLQSQESHRAMLAMMMQRPPDTGMELMKVLLPLLIGQKTDPMDMATKLATLLKPAGPAASMTDQLEALGKMMELAAKLGDKGGDDAPAWLRGLQSVAPLIQQAMATPRQLPPAPAPAPNPPTPRELAPVQTPAPVVEPKADEPDAHPLLTLLDRSMASMVRAASRDGDPALYADWFVDQVDDEHVGELAGFLESGTVLDQLALRYPESAPHREWFGRLITAMIALLEEDKDESGSTGEPQPDDDENH